MGSNPSDSVVCFIPYFNRHEHSIFHIIRFSQNMNAITANLDVEGIGEGQKSVGVLMSPRGLQRS